MRNVNKFNQEIGESLKAWQPAKIPRACVLKGSYCVLDPLRKEKSMGKSYKGGH